MTLVLLAVALLLLPTPARSDDYSSSSAIVVPPNLQPFGMSYGEWSARWWQWVIMVPTAQSAGNWPTTGDCTTAQLGPVWFLFGIPSNSGPVRITCTIPLGKTLFFPIVNVECSNSPADAPFVGATPQARAACATYNLNLQNGVHNSGIQLAVTVDGQSIGNLTNFRAQSPDFDVTAPPNGYFGSAGGFFQSSADGFYLMLAPLGNGKHTIHFTGALTQGPNAGFKIDTVYDLTVRPE